MSLLQDSDFSPENCSASGLAGGMTAAVRGRKHTYSFKDIVIRPAMPADTESIARMLARSYRALLASDYEPSLLREALPLLAQAQPRLLTCGTYFIAEQDDRVLAAGGWTDFSPHGAAGLPGQGHIRHVATDPDAARQGLGRKVLERVIRSASAAGISVLHCQSTLTAVPFYESLGFRKRAGIEVRLPTGVLFPAVQMRREQVL